MHDLPISVHIKATHVLVKLMNIICKLHIDIICICNLCTLLIWKVVKSGTCKKMLFCKLKIDPSKKIARFYKGSVKDSVNFKLFLFFLLTTLWILSTIFANRLIIYFLYLCYLPFTPLISSASSIQFERKISRIHWQDNIFR